MTHAEELTKIAARLAEIAKEMESQPAPSKICAIGEKKMIHGAMYTKQKERSLHSCTGCAFSSMRVPCPNGGGDARKAVEDGGAECNGTIWKLVRK